jgi:predicted Rossmann fold flavoprotein
MNPRQIVVVGGGAAGFFAAITCAEKSPGASVTILERSPVFLAKVRISGGGRCNVTHACYNPRELSGFYPRGGQELLGPFQSFQPRDTVAWFESRGVPLKTELDGRIFPTTDKSQTIIDCLIRSAQAAGVKLLANHSVLEAARNSDGFALKLERSQTINCDRLMLATGGCRAAAAGQLAVSLGHHLNPPVPSLFTFHVAEPWLRDLAGISIPQIEVSVPDEALRASGPGLITHSGLSGPAILRLSAWGARELYRRNYQFSLIVNWLPGHDERALAEELDQRRAHQPARYIVNSPLHPIAARLWGALVLASGLSRETRWSSLSRSARHRLIQQLLATELHVTGKTLNQEEFVTCGGVRLNEVDFKTMESRMCKGLYFGGELLDIDGLTGGFNFQSAWTTGWLAGHGMAR